MSFPRSPFPQPKAAVSKSIPLPSSYVSRTASEVQLALDVADAEKRDERMFQRLVNGIQDRHRHMKQRAGLTSTPIRSTHTRSRNTDRYSIIDNKKCMYPATTIAKIADTHFSIDSASCINHYGNNNSNECIQSPPMLQPKNLSDSTLSDSDWSITGYDVSGCDDVECDEMDQEGDEAEMFVLDL